MSDENKPNAAPSEPQAKSKPVADMKASSPNTPPSSSPTEIKTTDPAAAKPAAAVTAAPAPKPVVPAKPAGPVPLPWDNQFIRAQKKVHGSGIREASTYLGQNYIVVDASIVSQILRDYRDDEAFDYLVDLTAVHYPKREGTQFDVVYILYSFAKNARVRVKAQIADGESLPSAVSIWRTANWLEREVFDMFGIRFDGHPDLKRILLPDGWKGHPLRKEHGIAQQDVDWVHENLELQVSEAESAQ
jgi:NADH-quinone oxidoreductase subunit C